MELKDCMEAVREFKKNSKTTCISNIYGNVASYNTHAEMYMNEGAILIQIAERFRTRLLFVTNDIDCLRDLIKRAPSRSICEYLFKEKESEQILQLLFKSIGLTQYDVFVRTTETYDISPYSVPEVGRRKMLEEMYDPNFGEYPEESDAEELFELNKSTFDELCDDVFTLEEWLNIIKEKRVLVHKENGEIVCFFVWRLEGKKHYSNTSVNQGPANYMYNLERRVFEMYWEQGIRTYYWWISRKNSMQRRRGNKNKRREDVVKARSYLYNGIYIKE